MINLRKTVLLISAIGISILLIRPVQAETSCPKFPKVVWWNTSHEKVTSYVAKKHGGDWTPYVKKWGRQLEKMKKLHENGGTAVFKSKQLKLEGDILLQYVVAIEERVTVIRCLADQQMVNAGDKKQRAVNDG